MPFRDRSDAGRQLARVLESLRDQRPVILGLPRGGVPVASEVARALNAPLDVILVRKLGVPVQPELAMGAIGEDGVVVHNPEVLTAVPVDEATMRAVEAQERSELARRAELFRAGRTRLSLRDRVVVLVDDGIATGSTARAAIAVARAHGASRVILAVPVAPPQTLLMLAEEADQVVCLEQPDPFMAVGQFFRDFSQTSDAEVVACLSGSTT